MDLYEVMAEGCHKPLNPQEIAALYHARQCTRHDPCKPLGKTNWRTIDELFPLLKYDEGDTDLFAGAATPARKAFPVLTLSLLTAALLASVVHFAWNRAHDEWNKESRNAGKGGEGLRQDAHPIARVSNPIAPSSAQSSFVTSAPTPYRTGRAVNTANQQRLEAEKRQREQLARDQAARADQLRRESEERQRAAQKAAGQDYHIPLDRYFSINHPSLKANVKVHDNDVTSFDVWINGRWRREVRKEKGVTHSGTDETLIYNNSQAALYYVWEISGQLNHCLLRVREN